MSFGDQPRIQAYRGGMIIPRYISEFMTLTDVSDIYNYHIFVCNEI